jgi:hypothetical protein
MLDAFLARVKPALAPPLEGSPLERLHPECGPRRGVASFEGLTRRRPPDQ